MSQPQGMRISFAALIGWVVGVGVLVWGLGAYPTYRLAGGVGLEAESAAAVTVMVVMIVSAGVVRINADLGPARAAMAFLYSCAVRILACVGLTVGLWALLDLPIRILFVWTSIFYVSMLTVEGTWLARALGRDAYLEALGEIRTPTKRLPSNSTPRDQGENPVVAGQHKSD
jgi:hypothetical protein